jgi:hypothetical protein
MGVLLGGHVFNVSRDQLLPWLQATIVTGLVLAVIEAFPRARWFYQGRGVFVFLKLALMCSIPWLWEYRVAILMLMVVVASVGSHMPGRVRLSSRLHRRGPDG